MSERTRATEESYDWLCDCRLRKMTSSISHEEHAHEHTYM